MSDQDVSPGVTAQTAEATAHQPEAERRSEARLQKLFYGKVHCRLGVYRAMVVNISRHGALITITDPSFELTQQMADIGLAGLRVASHFGEGLRLQLEEHPVSVTAEVVRLSEGKQEGSQDEWVFWIGCKFTRPLSKQECAALGILYIDEPEQSIVGQAATVVGAGIEGADRGQPVVVVQGSVEPARQRRREDQRPAQVRIDATAETMTMHDLLELAVARRASDLHIKAGSPVRLRVDGQLFNAGERILEPDDARALVCELLTPEQFDRFEESGDLDLAYALEGQARFRVNVLKTRREMGLAIRRIPEDVPTVEQLGLAPVCTKLAEYPRGLVLVTGPTGSGKSTTLASMVQHINRTRACHIVTMEDPIEFLHKEIRAHITQREIGCDTSDFASALKRAMRQDPDVILVGEMRDLETMSLAVTAAETGHLVFATLHTTSAVLTVDRIVDVFPPVQQRQIRMQLADALRGIICQTLVPKVGGGVVVAQAVLMATAGVRALIREGKTPQMTNMMQTGAKDGMQTLEDSLNDLIARRLITYDTAIAKANHPNAIDRKGKPLRREG